jgi:hypothetical protein
MDPTLPAIPSDPPTPRTKQINKNMEPLLPNIVTKHKYKTTVVWDTDYGSSTSGYNVPMLQVLKQINKNKEPLLPYFVTKPRSKTS